MSENEQPRRKKVSVVALSADVVDIKGDHHELRGDIIGEFWNKKVDEYLHFVSYNKDTYDDLMVDLITSFEKEKGVTIPRDATVLDVGAGFGLGSHTIKAALGFNGTFDAIEPSEKMREKTEHGLFRTIFTEPLHIGQRGEFEENHYDLVIALGAFSKRAISAVCLLEVARGVKSGGYLALVEAIESFEDLYHDAPKTMNEYIDQWEQEGVLSKCFQKEYPSFFGGYHSGFGIVLKKL